MDKRLSRFVVPGTQRGSVLLIGFVLLLVITMLSITAMRTTALQERMSGNLRDRGTAFQAAEIALRQGEQPLRDNISFTVVPATAGYYEPTLGGASPPSNLGDDSAWASNTMFATSVYGTEGNTPKFIIEKLPAHVPLVPGEPVKTDQFRVSALGMGASASTKVVLQSYFVRYK